MKENKLKKLVILTLIAIIFAYIESAVVVYLRELYYPENILKIFPLKFFKDLDLKIELGREACTLLLLLAISLVAFEERDKRIASFFFLWGMWDILYYIWLKIFINWPQTLKDWDVLFLIPVPWIAPFITPVFYALSFIILSSWIILKDKKINKPFFLLLSFSGMFLGFISFIWVTFQKDFQKSLIPKNFPWILYIFSFILFILGTILSFSEKSNKKLKF